MVQKITYYRCNKQHEHNSFKDAFECDKLQASNKRIIKSILNTEQVHDEFMERNKYHIKNEKQFELFSKYIEDRNYIDDRHLGNWDGIDGDNKWCDEGWYYITSRVREYTGCTDYNFILKKVNEENPEEDLDE